MDDIVRGRYRHFKGGVYIVIGTATHSETVEEFVIYHKDGSGLVVTDEEQKLWARPVKMWDETVYWDGSEKPRFELLNTIPASNADRIRAMTDEELAEFVTGTDMCELLCGPGPRYCKSRCDEKCLEWLKKEANHDRK